MKKEELFGIAGRVRRDILEMIYRAGTGHPGGSLSAVELMAALYFGILNADPKNPDWEERDRFFLSNGHICPAQYAVMAEMGYFDRSLLWDYAKLGSPLQGHPERMKLKGVEATSGPLGLGLAQAAGYAAAARLDRKSFRVYCMTSDAEHNEGNHWEAVMFAAKYKLSNLTLMVDANGIQIEGTTDEIMPLGNLGEKYKAFDWNVIDIDGHDFSQILEADKKARAFESGPSVIIARTTFGKGVSFMEGDPLWHAKAPSEEEYRKAMEELK